MAGDGRRPLARVAPESLVRKRSGRLLQSALMPGATILIVVGSWVLLALLTLLAYRFNRGRGKE